MSKKEFAVPQNEMPLVWELVRAYLAGNGGNLSYAFDEVLSEYAALRRQFRDEKVRPFIARKRQGEFEWADASVIVSWNEFGLKQD